MISEWFNIKDSADLKDEYSIHTTYENLSISEIWDGLSIFNDNI